LTAALHPSLGIPATTIMTYIFAQDQLSLSVIGLTTFLFLLEDSRALLQFAFGYIFLCLLDSGLWRFLVFWLQGYSASSAVWVKDILSWL
jgi:hypothetical protein